MKHGLETILKSWPDESQEAEKLVVKQYGEQDEKLPSELT